MSNFEQIAPWFFKFESPEYAIKNYFYNLVFSHNKSVKENFLYLKDLNCKYDNNLINSIIEYLQHNNYTLLIKETPSSYRAILYFQLNISLVIVDIIKNQSIDMHSISVDDELLEKTKAILLPILEVKSTQKLCKIYSIISDTSGLDISLTGSLNCNFIEENYSQDLIKEFKHIKNCLQSNCPCGKIVLLDGLPGTGKTYFMKGLIESLDENAVIILVPSHLVANLGDPQILPIFNKIDKKQIILLLEDADQVLVPRQSDNMSSISSLLNISSGIMGSLLDIRVIATTNAKKTEIDSAILREGRLCKRLTFNKLGTEQSSKRFQELTGKSKNFDTPVTLAQLYKFVYQENETK